MITDEIKKYVAEQRTAGFSDSEIKGALAASGWSERDITELVQQEAPAPQATLTTSVAPKKTPVKSTQATPKTTIETPDDTQLTKPKQATVHAKGRGSTLKLVVVGAVVLILIAAGLGIGYVVAVRPGGISGLIHSVTSRLVPTATAPTSTATNYTHFASSSHPTTTAPKSTGNGFVHNPPLSTSTPPNPAVPQTFSSTTPTTGSSSSTTPPAPATSSPTVTTAPAPTTTGTSSHSSSSAQ